MRNTRFCGSSRSNISSVVVVVDDEAEKRGEGGFTVKVKRFVPPLVSFRFGFRALPSALHTRPSQLERE